MSWLYRNIFRPALFTQDSERIHNFTLRLLGWAAREKMAGALLEKQFAAPELPIDLFGLKFPNPVGLAAGLDKHAGALPIWEKLGFGFCELGGVTWHPQPGNPVPRMFRAMENEALINRMGFNNLGAEAVAARLADWKKNGLWPINPVGINLGKSKITPLEDAAEDYANSFCVLRNHADFFVINVSSPNTPGLRQLQDKAALDEILAAVQQENRPLNPENKIGGSAKPVLVKIAPDLSFDAIDEILALIAARKISGIVATNTTISRPLTKNNRLQNIYAEAGGLSGRPLRERSTEIIRHVFRQTRGALPIIGVGGIFNADDALAKIFSGASLVQVYTGLVYEGPGIAKTIVRGLCERLDQEGFLNLRDAIGITARL